MDGTPKDKTVDLVAAGAEAVVDNAKRLGLTWQLNYATTVSSELSAASWTVIMDGDDVAITVISLIGKTPNGSRVAVLSLPTGANYAIGMLTVGRGSVVSEAASQTSSAALAAETAVLTGGTALFLPGHAYEFLFGGLIAGSVVNIASFRIRRDTVAGTFVLGSYPYDTAGASNRYVGLTEIATNTTTAIISYAPCLTLSPSAGTVTHVGSLTVARYLVVRDIGLASDYPGFPSV